MNVALVCVAVAETRRGGPDGDVSVALGVAGALVAASVGTGVADDRVVDVDRGVGDDVAVTAGDADAPGTATAVAVTAGDAESGGIAADAHAPSRNTDTTMTARTHITIERGQALGRSIPRSRAKSIAS